MINLLLWIVFVATIALGLATVAILLLTTARQTAERAAMEQALLADLETLARALAARRLLRKRSIGNARTPDALPAGRD